MALMVGVLSYLVMVNLILRPRVILEVHGSASEAVLYVGGTPRKGAPPFEVDVSALLVRKPLDAGFFRSLCSPGDSDLGMSDLWCEFCGWRVSGVAVRGAARGEDPAFLSWTRTRRVRLNLESPTP